MELSSPKLTKVTGGNGLSFTKGMAGAYGSSDGSGITATGEKVDGTSMGVAIPISWPNYRSYLGKAIEIQYGESIVLAKINDVGVLSGRDLDLQPGIFKLFGFNTSNEWGIRSIAYCVL